MTLPSAVTTQSSLGPTETSNTTAAEQWLEGWGRLRRWGRLLATLPYTAIYLLNLWSLPHYQFFPLLLIGVAALCYQRNRELCIRHTGPLRTLR
ncbi:MAG: hypothetical protein R3C09_03730 [Pirellulaceae bacterium]